MRNILIAADLLVLLTALFPSCNKEELINDKKKVTNDYLPLKVGAKYKYNYSASYVFVYESSIKAGECIWKFISKSDDNIYQVEQSFTGDSIYRHYGPDKKDSTHIENQISTLSFRLNDKNVSFTFPMPFWRSGTVTLERFFQSDKTDTCFILNYINRGCLRKDVGITDLDYTFRGNHIGYVSYSLIEGPTY